MAQQHLPEKRARASVRCTLLLFHSLTQLRRAERGSCVRCCKLLLFFFVDTDDHLFLWPSFTCKCFNFVINCDLIRFVPKRWYLVVINLLDITGSEISIEWGPDVRANGNNLVLCQQIIINSDRDKLHCAFRTKSDEF